MVFGSCPGIVLPVLDPGDKLCTWKGVHIIVLGTGGEIMHMGKCAHSGLHEMITKASRCEVAAVLCKARDL